MSILGFLFLDIWNISISFTLNHNSSEDSDSRRDSGFSGLYVQCKILVFHTTILKESENKKQAVYFISSS